MKKFFIGVVAVVTVGALVLVGCPDDSGSGGNGGGPVVGCVAPASGDATIGLLFGDGNYDSCAQTALSGTGVFNNNNDSSTDVVFEETTGTGANNTTSFYRMNVVTADLDYAGAFVRLNEAVNVTGQTLKFSIRSEETGGNNKIRVYLQDTTTAQNTNTEAIETFTNDGEWRDISIDIDTVFVGNPALLKTGISAIGFVVQDTDDDTSNGVGAQIIDIDEIRLEGPSTTGGMTYDYVCDNGVATSGTTTTEGVSRCASCTDTTTHRLNGAADAIGTTCVAITCVAPVSGDAVVDLVYGDVNYTSCSRLALSTDPPAFGQFSQGGAGFTFSEVETGAASSANAYSLDVTVASTGYAGGFVRLNEVYDATGKSLKFSIKSQASDSGGHNSIRVFFENTEATGANQTDATEGIITFTNDGIWQDVEIVIADEYAFGQANIDATKIGVIGFAMEDANGADSGRGEQTINIDEIRFEDSGTTGGMTYDYVCDNGVATSGTSPTEGVSRCASCTDTTTHRLSGAADAIGTTCVAITCVAPASGDAVVDLVYGDVNYTSCSRLALSTDPPAFGQFSQGDGFTFSEVETGAASSANAYSLDVTVASTAYAGGFVRLNEVYDATGKSLKFSIKSQPTASGGHNSIRVFFENTEATGANQTDATEGIITFTNDGVWQDVEIVIPNEYTFGAANIDASKIGVIGFAIQDANFLSVPGLGTQTINIDEIRFEDAPRFPYVCANGTPLSGGSFTEGVTRCRRCSSTHRLDGVAGEVGTTCVARTNAYICTNGTPADGTSATPGASNCAYCDSGYAVTGTPGVAGSTCTALSGCIAPLTGRSSSVSSIYTDGNYAACSALTLASSNDFGVSSTDSTATFAGITTGAASGTTNARTLSNPTAGNDAASGLITLAGNTNVSGKVLRFSIMSPVTDATNTGTNRVRVYLQADPGSADSYRTDADEGVMTFTQDGTWQEVSIVIDNEYDFAGANISSSTVRSIGFALLDGNGGAAGIGVQTLSIDEVRFEDHTPNCTAPATGNANVGLIWGDNAYDSCSEIAGAIYTERHVPTRNSGSRPPSPVTLASNAGGGGFLGTPLSTNLSVGAGNSAWVYAIADLAAAYDITGRTLKFSIKSPSTTGGTNSVAAFLAGSGSATSPVVTRTFVNDGTWQALSFPADGFTTGGFTGTTVQRVIISVTDANGLSSDGVGAQQFDIDEIRFEQDGYRCTAPVSGNAAIDLVYGDGEYASCSRTGVASTEVYNTSNNSNTAVVFGETAGVGASDTTEFYSVDVTDAALRDAGVLVRLGRDINTSGKTLRFSVRSREANEIRVFIEDRAGTRSALHEAIEVFENNGVWQEISIDVDTEYVGTANLDKAAISTVRFDARDANLLSVPGLGRQLIEIDEIRFE